MKDRIAFQNATAKSPLLWRGLGEAFLSYQNSCSF